jgi:hypothetical protein
MCDASVRVMILHCVCDATEQYGTTTGSTVAVAHLPVPMYVENSHVYRI